MEGYPVAVVQSVSRDGSNYFATVKAKPLAELDRLRYLLLLWPSNLDMSKVKSMSPEEVRRLVQQRLESQANEATHSVSKTKITDDQEDGAQPQYRKEIVDPDIPTTMPQQEEPILRISNNIGKKTNARAFYFQWATILCFFVVALIMELAPWPAGFQAFKPSWLVLVLLYWTLALPDRVSIWLGIFTRGFMGISC